MLIYFDFVIGFCLGKVLRANDIEKIDIGIATICGLFGQWGDSFVEQGIHSLDREVFSGFCFACALES